MPPVLPRSVTAQLFPSDMLGLHAVMRGTLAPLMLTQRIVQVSQLPALEAMRKSLLRQVMPAGYFTALALPNNGMARVMLGVHASLRPQFNLVSSAMATTLAERPQ